MAGMKHPDAVLWKTIIKRCTNPKARGYERYGGKGVRVCDRWRKFANFIADMGPRPSRLHQIDRIDNGKGYEPGNCRWVLDEQQRKNKRRFASKLTSDDVIDIRTVYAFGGSISDIAAAYGIAIQNAWSIVRERAWRDVA